MVCNTSAIWVFGDPYIPYNTTSLFKAVQWLLFVLKTKIQVLNCTLHSPVLSEHVLLFEHFLPSFSSPIMTNHTGLLCLLQVWQALPHIWVLKLASSSGVPCCCYRELHGSLTQTPPLQRELAWRSCLKWLPMNNHCSRF